MYLKSKLLRDISKSTLDYLIRDLKFVDYGNRMHALVGITPFCYKFSTAKSKHLFCHSAPRTALPIMNLASLALKGHPLADLLNFSHCVVTTYRHGQRVGKHADDDAMCVHDGILSISFGAEATVIIDGSPFNVVHGDALLFCGSREHEVKPVRGEWRYNFSFRSWNTSL